MIRFEPGTVYDVAHLRPFDLELAKVGHPLAYEYEFDSKRVGVSVRHFRMMSEKLVTFDAWIPDETMWRGGGFSDARLPDIFLRLAPLSTKDGRGLHVGDEIEVYLGRKNGEAIWDRELIVAHDRGTALLIKSGYETWRWPESKA